MLNGKKQQDNKIKKIGIIAGNGRFPIIVAQNAQKLDIEVIAVAHIGETLAEIEEFADKTIWVKVGKLARMIDAFKQEGVKDVLMAGGIKKTRLFTDVIPDLKSILLLSKLACKQDDSILRAVAAELEKEGLTVRESHLFLRSILAPKGAVYGRKPGTKEMDDIHFGWNAAKEFGKLDVGQCIVIKNKVILAVEAVEGTDETIKRGGRLCKKGAIVVKVSKPGQDLRFDVPAVGPNTIQVMSEANANILAIEADKTLMIDKEEMLVLAKEKRISIISL